MQIVANHYRKFQKNTKVRDESSKASFGRFECSYLCTCNAIEQVLRKIHRLFVSRVESYDESHSGASSRERVDVTKKKTQNEGLYMKKHTYIASMDPWRRLYAKYAPGRTSEAFALLFNKNANAAI